MGYRVKIWFLILVIFLLNISGALAEEPVVSVKVRSAGELLFSDFSNLDLSFEDASVSPFVSKDDLVNYAIFQSLIYSNNYEYLLSLVKEVKDARLKETLLYELYITAKKNGNFKQFEKVFSKFIDEHSEKLKLFLKVYNNDLTEVSFRNKDLNTFFNAYISFVKGDYKKAVEDLKEVSHIFPRTYYYFLMNAGEYEAAFNFISNSQINDKSFYLSLANYYLDRCELAAKDLSNKVDTYEKMLIQVECGERVTFGDYLDKRLTESFLDDPFLMYVNFKRCNLQNQPELFQPYKTLYYSYKLKNYILALSLYKEEIEQFVAKMNQINLELKQILDRYDIVWNEIEKSGLNKEIRKKVIEIQEKTKGLKNLSFFSSFRVKEHLTMFEEQYKNTLALLENSRKQLLSKREEEQAKAMQEAEIIAFLSAIREKKKIAEEEFKDLVDKIERLYQISATKRLPSEEDLAFARLYVLWTYSQDLPYDKKGAVLEEIKKQTKLYLQKYKEREKEALLLLAEVCEGLGESEDAINAYNNYLALEGNPEGRVLMKLAELLFDKGDYNSAIIYFKKAAAKSESYRNAAQYKIGWSYYLLGKLPEVAELFFSYDFKVESEKALMLIDEMMELLSRVFFKLGEDKIEVYLNKYPNFPKPEKLFKGVGDLYLFLADYDKALKVYEKGLVEYYLYEDSAELLNAKIELLNLLGKYDVANQEKYRFINLYSENSNYYKKFNAYPKQYKEILFSTALHFNVQYEKLSDEDLYKKSVSLYEKFITNFKEDEKAGEASFLLAQLEEGKKEYVKASEHFSFAWQRKFKEDESLYRALYCKYKLWQDKKLDSQELIISLKEYAETYHNTERTLSTLMVLSDMLLKENREQEMLDSLDKASNNFGAKGLIKVTDFCEANFKLIADKKRLAIIFGKAFDFFKDRRYLELKHYALFSLAKINEDGGKLDEAKLLYTQIIDDFNTTSFREFALFNLALLLEKEGKVSDAVKTMELIKDRKELAYKAKDFVFIFGKKAGFFVEAAEASLELAKLEPQKTAYYLLEAGWLFIKSGKFNRAEEALKRLEKLQLSEEERASHNTLKGILAYNNSDFNLAFELFFVSSKSVVKEEYEEDFIKFFHDTLSKTIFLKPEDEARDALESFIDFLGRRFKATAKPDYLFNIAETLSDFSLFFLQKDEAIAKSIEFYKRSLKLSIMQNNSKLVIKNLAKLKELKPEQYARELYIPDIELNFLEEIKHGEVLSE